MAKNVTKKKEKRTAEKKKKNEDPTETPRPVYDNKRGNLVKKTWDEHFANLQAFKAKYGHCRVTISYQVDIDGCGEGNLGRWLIDQKTSETLTPEQRQKLDSIGIDWETTLEKRDRVWNQQFERLKEYKRIFGDTRVPLRHTNKDLQPWVRALGSWVSSQRQKRKAGTLSKEREEKLNSIGFAWILRRGGSKPRSLLQLEEAWLEQYNKLAAYKKKHGHCNVPKSYRDHVLKKWVNTQRNNMKKAQVSQERKDLLDKIGFDWRVDKDAKLQEIWDGHFNDLVEYKNKYGHCHVPHLYKEQNNLGRWLGRQSEMARAGSLPRARAKRLKELGVNWQTRQLWVHRGPRDKAGRMLPACSLQEKRDEHFPDIEERVDSTAPTCSGKSVRRGGSQEGPTDGTAVSDSKIVDSDGGRTDGSDDLDIEEIVPSGGDVAEDANDVRRSHVVPTNGKSVRTSSIQKGPNKPDHRLLSTITPAELNDNITVPSKLPSRKSKPSKAGKSHERPTQGKSAHAGKIQKVTAKPKHKLISTTKQAPLADESEVSVSSYADPDSDFEDPNDYEMKAASKSKMAPARKTPETNVPSPSVETVLFPSIWSPDNSEERGSEASSHLKDDHIRLGLFDSDDDEDEEEEELARYNGKKRARISPSYEADSDQPNQHRPMTQPSILKKPPKAAKKPEPARKKPRTESIESTKKRKVTPARTLEESSAKAASHLKGSRIRLELVDSDDDNDEQKEPARHNGKKRARISPSHETDSHPRKKNRATTQPPTVKKSSSKAAKKPEPARKKPPTESTTSARKKADTERVEFYVRPGVGTRVLNRFSTGWFEGKVVAQDELYSKIQYTADDYEETVLDEELLVGVRLYHKLRC